LPVLVFRCMLYLTFEREGYAARVGAPRVSPAQLDHMRQALAGMEEVQAGPTFSESKEHVAHDHALAFFFDNARQAYWLGRAPRSTPAARSPRF
jgi:hypothetical protein